VLPLVLLVVAVVAAALLLLPPWLTAGVGAAVPCQLLLLPVCVALVLMLEVC